MTIAAQHLICFQLLLLSKDDQGHFFKTLGLGSYFKLQKAILFF